MNIYQHFRPEERGFIDQVLQWKQTVIDTYAVKLTDFLDPRAREIVNTIIGHTTEVRCYFFGGVTGAERQRAIIAPEYYSPDENDYQIEIYEIQYPTKFIKLEHPQVLGSLMSLGLKRDKFGDILIVDDRIQFIVAKEIKDFVSANLESIGKAKISLKEIPFREVIFIEDQWQEVVTTVSSMRLDTVISALYNISRQKSQQLIDHGLVKVNHGTVEKTSFECGSSDLISVRGYGRVKILSIDGKTKKDKWRIVAGKQK